MPFASGSEIRVAYVPEATFDTPGTAEDIDAVAVLGNGHVLISTEAGDSLGGLAFLDGDVVEWDPVNLTASLFFSEALFGADVDIDAFDGALMPDLIGGSIQAAMTEFSTALPLHKGDQGHIIAIASSNRSKLAPDIPTFIEGGVPNFVAQSYIGVVAPAGTPAPIIADLQKAIAAGLASGEAPDKLRGMGSEIATPKQMTPEGFAEFIRADYENMRQAAKLAGITPQ